MQKNIAGKHTACVFLRFTLPSQPLWTVFKGVLFNSLDQL